ncbi:LysR family transcriptional regulator [Loktanella sp. TSTF-M6]|uniref:LysR family transcriptional regulator n=1 Tax=Loktanella gaetbuli TaxID=2881335 RepID=A0ABS8BW53_9RHOB|nr:LysR family transcriptional regulator [Loktanella gaetbuli]MCB5199940.1 LysR family transcriptional regulator [Loktanella gaetbuli]
MDHWAEMRTALQVARLGTVSAAAEVLGVHRATVVRHIDLIETALGAPIFFRNRSGFVPTEAGRDMMQVAQATEDQFKHLAQRTRDSTSDLTGDLIVTAHEQVARSILPAIRKVQNDHPQLGIKFIASGALLKLEYGQAHVAIRTGPKPEQPDNVVQPFRNIDFGLFAHDSYLLRFGRPDTPRDLTGHTFICWDAGNPNLPFADWLRTHVPRAQIKFVTASQHVAECAVAEGIGIGFCARPLSARRAELSEVYPPLPEWSVPLWLVTHVDLHRTAKVQAFLSALKSPMLPL